jgi:hypothetical protein
MRHTCTIKPAVQLKQASAGTSVPSNCRQRPTHQGNFFVKETSFVRWILEIGVLPIKEVSLNNGLVHATPQLRGVELGFLWVAYSFTAPTSRFTNTISINSRDPYISIVSWNEFYNATSTPPIISSNGT